MFHTKKKPEAKAAEKIETKKTTNASPPAEDVSSATPLPSKVHRELVSIHPSEAKAWVAVDGKKQKVVYHTNNGEALIGLPGAGSVLVSLWLAGQADLKGLPGV